MSKYIKLELEEFSRSAVVNTSMPNEDSEVEQIINSVVTEHIAKITDDESEKSSEKRVSHTESTPSKEELDRAEEIRIKHLEEVKQEAYNCGIEDTKAKYEPMLLDQNNKNDFGELLQQKLSSIIPENKIDDQITKVSAKTIASIARKLHLMLPADFDMIINHGLINKLKNFYKEGSIRLKIHPDRYELCIQLLQLESLEDRIKENFSIVQDNKMSLNDCSLEWSDTKLEYNQEQLNAEIGKIIEQISA